MKKYEGINDSIAALSPCISKTHEFDATQYVKYNVTLKKLYEYIRRNNIRLPAQESGFDHAESSLGCLYAMPGGLKENVELYLGKKLRIDKSEGSEIVYKALKEFSEQSKEHYPAIFDVLNCQEGCNLGTGCAHERSIFEINSIMDSARQSVISSHENEDPEELLREFDSTLRLSDFIRRYTTLPTRSYAVSEDQVEHSFIRLGKETAIDRIFDCSACGADTCLEMAQQIANGLNTPANCIQKVRTDVHKEHDLVMELSATNVKNIEEILADISQIKDLSDDIFNNVSGINTAIDKYTVMAVEINKIAMKINIIALNASVEAARAGQYGKAFGVVAEEIRNLANSSKNTVSETEEVTEHASRSIKDINSMVTKIMHEVEKAYKNISDISENTQKAMEKDGLISDD
jgi:hypothetical protein